MDDVRDMEAVRKHFAAEKTTPIGYSYMGLPVMLYAHDDPQHVGRIVQLDPVPIMIADRPRRGHQSFDEYPEVVIPAIDQFLNGAWPASSKKVT
jgi:pimeloyl-ACP methyl ester carboxylesterase